VVTFLKTLIVLGLALVVFGGAGYFGYHLYLKPEQELQRELESPESAPPAIVDTTLPEFQKCLEIEAVGDPLASRRAFLDFVEMYPDSPSAEEARFRVGRAQVTLLLSGKMTPDKLVYTVKSGDNLNRLCNRLKCHADLLLQMNHLESSKLRAGDRLVYTPANFSAHIDRPLAKVVVMRGGEFFGQYRILSVEGGAKIGMPKKGNDTVAAKVTDKPGWLDGVRVASNEKNYLASARWIVLQPGGHTVYGVSSNQEQPLAKPSSGYGVDTEAIRLLAAVLGKNDTVTIR
jgi:LysM repeat protein